MSALRSVIDRNAWLLAAAFVVAPLAWAVPFRGDKDSLPAETDPDLLKPGQFIWEGDAVPAGPVTVAVSLEEQRVYVYRNGIRVGITTASTGKPGHGTPTGVFVVLQKDKDHHSKTCGNAPMPYSERLTWDGVALHAGGIPGYPSSHGCVHLPSEFARRLLEISPMGMVVVIADAHSGPAHVRHPATVTPIDAATGAEVENPRLGTSEDYRWTPETSPDGPLSILVSGADQRVLVFRNGVEVGRAMIQVRDPGVPLGTHAYVRLDEAARRPDAVADGAKPRWVAVGVPGHEADKGLALDPNAVERVSMPPEFVAKLRPLVAPGDALLVTDGAVLEHTTGVSVTVVTTNPPPAPAPSDAKVAGTDYHATGDIPCFMGGGQPTGACAFGVKREGNGSGMVTVTKPDGRTRTIFFANGRATGADVSQADPGSFSATRESDLNIIRIGQERYEIPDAVISGG